MLIIGISSHFHDSSIAIIKDGEILTAVQEERFTRIKNDASFPINSLKYALDEFNISLDDIDSIVYFDKPFIKFERLLETIIYNSPKSFTLFLKSMPIWLKEKLFFRKYLTDQFYDLLIQDKLSRKEKRKVKDNLKNKILFSEHHLSHAAAAFYPSPFEKAAILTVDGVGEWSTTSISIGVKNNIVKKKHINFPNSIGLLYSSFTYYLGFKVNSGEYKMMGLAPYGEDKYSQLILKHLIDIKEDSSFQLNMDYFSFQYGLRMINNRFESLFNHKRREPNEEILQFHMDIAKSIQVVVETIILRIATHIKDEYKLDNICLAGGVALNCVANGKLLKSKIFKDLWIQPAAGDAGSAIGAALAAYHLHFKHERNIIHPDKMKGALLGPSYSNQEVKKILDKANANYVYFEDFDELIALISQEIVNDKVIGWHQGKLEFGPRALGSRSILASPLNTKMQRTLNLKIKYRESFRPFAPIVMEEYASQYFDIDTPSPYMLLVADVKIL